MCFRTLIYDVEEISFITWSNMTCIFAWDNLYLTSLIVYGYYTKYNKSILVNLINLYNLSTYIVHIDIHVYNTELIGASLKMCSSLNGLNGINIGARTEY